MSHDQVEESTSAMKGTTEDEFEPRDVALEPDSHTVNIDTERDKYQQDTEVVDINAPEDLIQHLR